MQFRIITKKYAVDSAKQLPLKFYGIWYSQRQPPSVGVKIAKLYKWYYIFDFPYRCKNEIEDNNEKKISRFSDTNQFYALFFP